MTHEQGIDTAPASRAQDLPDPFTMGRLGKHTLVYGAGVLLSKGLSFVMLPVYTRYLTATDYGVISLIMITLDVISIAAGSQIAEGIYRFYHKAEHDAEKEAVVATALIALGASYLLVGVTVALAAPLLSRVVFDTARYAALIRLAAGGLAFQACLIVPLAFARVRDRSVFYVGASAAKLALGAGLNVLFIVQMRMGPAGVFASGLITNAVVGLGLTTWLSRRISLRPSRVAGKSLVRYGLPLVATQFATFIATFGDRFVLQKTAGTTEVGIYSLAYQFGFLLVVVGFMPFAQIWQPKRFEIAPRPDRDDLLARGFIYTNVLLLTVAVGIVLFVKPVLRVMSAASFQGAAAFVPVILVAYVFQSWAKTQDIGILVSERTEYVTAADWAGALVAVAGYVSLIPRYGGWGAAVATVLSFFVRWALAYRFSQRLWHVRYRWAPVLRLLALALAISGGSLLLPRLGIVTSVALRLALLAVYGIGLWHLGVLTPRERSGLVGAARLGWTRGTRRLPEWVSGSP